MEKTTRRLPAEWEPHEGILLAFPHEGRDWPGKYQAVKWAFVEFIKKVTLHENVFLVTKNESHKVQVESLLNQAHIDLSQVNFLLKDTNRSWMRDSGPVIVKHPDGKREALRFRFNGWAKYPNHLKDRNTPQAVADHLRIPFTRVIFNNKQVVLEGGAIESNGCGTLITTEECLLDPVIQVRNPGFTRQNYEKVFHDYLGITNIIWLGKGIEGDDTHGHVDDICRFVNRNTVVACREPNTADLNHKRLEDNFSRLRAARLENGESLEIIEMPLPGRIDFDNMRLPASYVNFLTIKDCILVPTFNDKNDYKALGILNEAFPFHEIVGINAIDLIWGLGALHCLSHEIPL